MAAFSYAVSKSPRPAAARPGRNVGDEIDVASDADPVDLTLRVQEALDRNALILDDTDVTVEADGNTVNRSGHVRTWAELDAATDATWMASGVYDVQDDLFVTG